jgi:hypothetical protein
MAVTTNWSLAPISGQQLSSFPTTSGTTSSRIGAVGDQKVPRPCPGSTKRKSNSLESKLHHVLMNRTLAQLGMSGSEAGVLDALSTSFGLVELHDRNYLNRTSEEEEGSHEYFEEDRDDTSIKERMKQWSTYQPHFITK